MPRKKITKRKLTKKKSVKRHTRKRKNPYKFIIGKFYIALYLNKPIVFQAYVDSSVSEDEIADNLTGEIFEIKNLSKIGGPYNSKKDAEHDLLWTFFEAEMKEMYGAQYEK